MATNTIYVKGGLPGKVGLWEINAAHPDGEVCVTGDDRVYKIAQTADANQALADGRIVRVTKGGNVVGVKDDDDDDTPVAPPPVDNGAPSAPPPSGRGR